MNYVVLTKDASLERRIQESLALCCEGGEAFASEVDMLRALRREPYDMIVIDARITDAASSALVSWRECHSQQSTPLLVVGSFADPATLFQWYEAGATDILSLQFNSNEFYVRAARAMMLNAKPADRDPPHLRVGPYTLHKACCIVELRGKAIQLTPREFATAWLFFSNAGVSLTRAKVAKSIWGSETDCAERTIEQHIYKLRKKLALGAEHGVLLRTVYSVGYRLEVSSSMALSHARFESGSVRTPFGAHVMEAA